MDDSKKAVLGQLYHSICLFSAIALTIWCIHQYSLNHDVTEIAFKEFHGNSDDIYPSLTLCLKDPFLGDRLRKYDQNLTISLYKAFLRGGAIHRYYPWKTEWAEINYDEVTITLEDFLTKINIFFLTNDVYQNHLTTWEVVNNSLMQKIVTSTVTSPQYETVNRLNSYVSARQAEYKCFTFDIPFIKGKLVSKLDMDVNASIFGEEIRPKHNEQFFITLNYPNQFIRSSQRHSVYLGGETTSSNCFLLETVVGSMEVFNRRDKAGERCNNDWRHHDQNVLGDIIGKVGCNPKHWMIKSKLEYCSTRQQYQEINKEFHNVKTYMPPCRGMEKLTETVYETDLGFKCFGGKWLYLTFDFHRETLYKEIGLVRAYSLQSLIGNAGKI